MSTFGLVAERIKRKMSMAGLLRAIDVGLTDLGWTGGAGQGGALVDKRNRQPPAIVGRVGRWGSAQHLDGDNPDHSGHCPLAMCLRHLQGPPLRPSSSFRTLLVDDAHDDTHFEKFRRSVSDTYIGPSRQPKIRLSVGRCQIDMK